MKQDVHGGNREQQPDGHGTSLPTAEAEAWVEAFRETAKRGGTGKTTYRIPLLDLDPQGTSNTPLGGPGLDLCRTCLKPWGEPSPGCVNPINH